MPSFDGELNATSSIASPGNMAILFCWPVLGWHKMFSAKLDYSKLFFPPIKFVDKNNLYVKPAIC